MPAAGRRRSKLGVLARGSRAGKREQKQGWVGSGWACARRPVCWPLLPPAGSAWNCGGAASFPDPRLGAFHTPPSSPLFFLIYTYLILCACQSSEGGLWESVPAFQCVGAGDRNSGHQSCSKPLYPQSHLAGLFLVREYLSTNILVVRPFVSLFPLPTLSLLWYCAHLVDCPRVSGRSASLGIVSVLIIDISLDPKQ